MTNLYQGDYFMKNTFISVLKENPNYHKYLKQVKYKKGQLITNYIKNRNQLCIIEKGTADLMRHDYNGNKVIVDRYYENELFGELFYDISTNNELFVVAKEETVIYELDYVLMQQLNNYEDIYKVLNDLFLQKIINHNTKIELMTKTTIRDKLLFYFDTLSRKTFSNKIKLPFSYTDLAAYLSINRSSMMREISILIDEGFILKDKKSITLLY